MLKSISITTAAAVFAFSGLAVAAGSSKSTGASGSTSSTKPSFAAVDKDHNGKISRSEWDAYFKSGSSSAGSTSKSSGMSQNKAASGSTSSPKKY